MSLKQKLTSTPVLRVAFGLLRGVLPIAKFGKTIIVTRYEDVQEVLTREEDFTVYEIDGYKMEEMGNPFVLGMDASPETTLDRDMLHKVIKREDLQNITVLMKELIAEVFDKELAQGKLDLVEDYARLISVRLVNRYFGVIADEKKMMEWQRAIFNQAFVNLNDDATIKAKGHKAAHEIANHITELIKERKNQETKLEDNVLNRLIHEQKDNIWLDDNAVKRNILCVLGVVENTSKVVCHIIDQLFKKPQIFAKVKAAADADDVGLIQKYSFDILRFNPHNPIIIRFCKNGSTIAKGTKREKRIKPGSTIYAATLSAMFDPRIVPNPKEVDPNRKVEYMHFGYGPHTCTGKYVSYVSVSEMVMAIMQLKNLRRAKGKAGRIKYVDLVFPETFTVQFDN